MKSTLRHLLARAVLDWQLDKHIGLHNARLYVYMLQSPVQDVSPEIFLVCPARPAIYAKASRSPGDVPCWFPVTTPRLHQPIPVAIPRQQARNDQARTKQ